MKTNKRIDDNDVKLAQEKAFKYIPIPIGIYSALGLWCSNPRSLLQKFKYFIIMVYFLNEVFKTVAMIQDISASQVDISDVATYSAIFNCPFKAVILMMKRDSLAAMICLAYKKKWTEPRNSGEKAIIDRNFSECRIVQKTYFTANSTSGIIYTFGPLYFYFLGMRSEFPAKIWFPYEVTNEFLFWISYIQSSIVVVYEAGLQYGGVLLYAGLLIQVRNQLQLLHDRARNFIRSAKSMEAKAEMSLLKELLQDQADIYELSRSINEFFARLLTLDVIVATPIICTSLYTITVNPDSPDFGFALAAFFYVLVLFSLQCWYSNECHVQSLEITRGFYEMDWWQLSFTTKKAIRTVITGTSPIEFKIAKVIPLNLVLFTKVLKSSFTAYNVLRKTNTHNVA